MAQNTLKMTFSFGGCSFCRTSPKKLALNPETKILNVMMTFEEDLRVNLAIDECVWPNPRLGSDQDYGASSALCHPYRGNDTWPAFDVEVA